MTTDGFLIFQSILREKKIPRQHLHELYVFSTDWVVNTRGVKRNLDYKDIHKAFASRKRRKG